MNKMFKTDLIRPFRLGLETGTDKNRVGGKAPKDIIPSSESAKYLITLEVNEDISLSVFLLRNAIYYIENDRQLHRNGSSAIEIIFHENRPRREDDSYASDLSGYNLIMGDEIEDADEVEGEKTHPSSGNKIGGESYLLVWQSRAVKLLESIESKGFQQFLQLDISMINNPELGIFIDGTWPYGDGLLHVYLKTVSDGFDWCCFWEN